MARAAIAWLGAALWACGGSSSTPRDAETGASFDAAIDAPWVPAPDLRFQWVDAASLLSFQGVGALLMAPGENGSAINANGGFGASTLAPLQLTLNGPENGNYAWDVTLVTPSPATTPIYGNAVSGMPADLDGALAADLGSNGGVVASVDIVPGAFAYVVESAIDGAGYTVVGSDVGSGELADYVAAEAGSGRVVTALSASPTAGLVRVYSAARAGDATAYATTVAAVATATFADACAALAGSGYAITAFGHVGSDAGFVVGTQRGSAALATTEEIGLSPATDGGAALVGWLIDVGSDVVGASSGDEIILEQ